jgi:hypothetical protein
MIGAYDSFKKAQPIAVFIPQIIVKIQNTHLHPNFSTTTPPRSGPIVGPKRGPSRYHPKMLARSCGVHISLIVPPPFAIPTLPKKPESVRTATSVATFGLNAVGICKSVKMLKQIRYSFLLPNVSESGASMRGCELHQIWLRLVHIILTHANPQHHDKASCSPDDLSLVTLEVFCNLRYPGCKL